MGIQGDLVLAAVVVRVILAALAVIFFLHFYLQWTRLKQHLSMTMFYTKWKVVNNNMMMGVGMAVLALGFGIEFISELGLGGVGGVGVTDRSFALGSGVLEAVGLACITFSFYRLMRLELPGIESVVGGKVKEHEERLTDALKNIDSGLVKGIGVEEEKEGRKGIKRKKKK